MKRGVLAIIFLKAYYEIKSILFLKFFYKTFVWNWLLREVLSAALSAQFFPFTGQLNSKGFYLVEDFDLSAHPKLRSIINIWNVKMNSKIDNFLTSGILYFSFQRSVCPRVAVGTVDKMAVTNGIVFNHFEFNLKTRNWNDKLNFDWISIKGILCCLYLSNGRVKIEEKKFESRTVGARMSSIALDASWSRPFYIQRKCWLTEVWWYTPIDVFPPVFIAPIGENCRRAFYFFMNVLVFFSNFGASRLQSQNMNIVIIIYLCLFVYCAGWDLIARPF